jgi:hypothetical protein
MTPVEAGYSYDGPCVCGENVQIIDEQECTYHDGTWVIAEARCEGLFCPPMLLQVRTTLAALEKKRRAR